jgi:DNA-binding beta-propeller fold protein YncE
MNGTQVRPILAMAQDAPIGCRLVTCSRAVILLLCATVAIFGVSVGQALPMAVPDTILLPDSLGPLRSGSHVVFGSSTDNIYVASESADILVVDGNTFQRIDRINTGPVGGAVLVDQYSRLYCSFSQQGRVGVIDCATNSIVRTIDVGTRPTLLCYSSGSDKLYCGDTIDHTVTAIDRTTDTVCKVVPVGRSLSAMVYDSTSNKVYAATRDGVCAISCVSDSLVVNFEAIKSSRGLCINKRRQKLYAVGPASLGPDPETLYVISTATDSVVAKIQWGYTGPLRLICNELTDRLYCMDYYGGLSEYDCVGDTWLRYRELGGRPQFGVPCDTVRNRLYYLVGIAMKGYVRTLDCATLDVISTTRVGDYPAALEQDLDRSRVILSESGTHGADAVLTVFDCKLDSLHARGHVPLCGHQWDSYGSYVAHNPVDRKLYYVWGLVVGAVGIVDEQTNRVVRNMLLPEESYVGEVEYSRTSDKLYCGSLPGVVVLDGASDSVLKLVTLAGGGAANLCWCPDYNKLYCTGMGGSRYYMAVLDCYTDSVIKEIEFYDRPGDLGPLYVGNGRLFYIYNDRMALIDCRNDSVLVDTALSGTISAVAYTAVGEKIYTVHGFGIDVLSSRTLSLLATVDWPYPYSNTFLACSDSTSKLYWFKSLYAGQPDSVVVIDTRGDSIVARMEAGFRQNQACLDHTGRYLFCPDESCNVNIYDTQSDSLAGAYENLPTCASLMPNPEQHSIYAVCGDVILVYTDAPPGVEEGRPQAPTCKPQASVVRGVLYMPRDMTETGSAVSDRVPRPALLDIIGRKVVDLLPGPNDISHLSPGIYFVREEPQASSPEPQAVRKVVVTR